MISNEEMRRHHHRPRSIFHRLLFIVLGAGILINLLVAGYFRMTARGPMRQLINRNLQDYLAYAVTDIGVPPNPAKAAVFSERSGFKVVFEGPSGVFKSSPWLKDMDTYRKACSDGDPNVGWTHHSFVILKTLSKGTFAFVTDPKAKVENHEAWLAALIAALVLVVAVAGWMVRRMLDPLRDLEGGMILAGQGNLDVKVEPRRDDELGRLTLSFNSMVARLKALLDSRRQLMLAVSHELRTPITRMKLGLEALKDREAAAGLGEDLEELGSMVREILEGEAVEAGSLRRQKTNLADLAREAAAELAYRSPGIDPSGLPSELEWEADPGRLAGALRNVLDNALKYSGEAAAKVELGLRLAEGRPEFTIRDHGPGIPESERTKVFEPFYRLEQSRSRKTGGYGLGLNLVKKIVEAHGGAATIEAAPGGGTLVRLKL